MYGQSKYPACDMQLDRGNQGSTMGNQGVTRGNQGATKT